MRFCISYKKNKHCCAVEIEQRACLIQTKFFFKTLILRKNIDLKIAFHNTNLSITKNFKTKILKERKLHTISQQEKVMQKNKCFPVDNQRFKKINYSVMTKQVFEVRIKLSSFSKDCKWQAWLTKRGHEMQGSYWF